jgi:glycosyltransferase involved in cell wall biosynthesis
MRIINIIDSVEQINYGIWHAVTVNAALLAEKGIQTELWYPQKQFNVISQVTNVPLESLSLKNAAEQLHKRTLDPQQDIIVTHGSWSYATRWGSFFKKKGFRWIYVPHGMLEPWPLQQKKIKKALYLHLIEKRMAKQADCIKAVSVPESINLKKFFAPESIRFIPNGVAYEPAMPDFKVKQSPVRYLFLSRLHHKKNLVALAAAWLQSGLNNNGAYELLIAGPDEGELQHLTPLLQQSVNMKYIGSVYGEKKKELLTQCMYYVLPSFSEGLPSSLLEAMSYGLMPIVTEGCNLPEVFSQHLGVKINTDIADIAKALQETSVWDVEEVAKKALKGRNFIKDHFSLEAVTDLQTDLFSKLLVRRQPQLQ